MRKIGILLAIVLFSLSTCSKKTILTDDMEEQTEKYDYYVDQYGNEGIVVYYYDLSTKCIVLSLDESEEAWSYDNKLVYVFPYEKKSDINTDAFGLKMLTLMCSDEITKYPAQNWCNEKNNGESPNVGSWRLPSADEWYDIFHFFDEDDFDDLNKAIMRCGGMPLQVDEKYWTCTEDLEGYLEFDDETLNEYDPANRAINMSPYLKVSTLKFNWQKQNRYRVRAIKYIYYEKSLY